MIVGTSEAAKILNISTPRLRVLLIEGRVEGAYKTGKIWLIPSLGAGSLGREPACEALPEGSRGRTAYSEANP